MDIGFELGEGVIKLIDGIAVVGVRLVLMAASVSHDVFINLYEWDLLD